MSLILSHDEKEFYDSIFHSYQNAGTLTRNSLLSILSSTELEKSVLRTIWSCLFDRDKFNLIQLDINTLYLMLRLVTIAQNYNKILTPQLVTEFQLKYKNNLSLIPLPYLKGIDINTSSTNNINTSSNNNSSRITNTIDHPFLDSSLFKKIFGFRDDEIDFFSKIFSYNYEETFYAVSPEKYFLLFKSSNIPKDVTSFILQIITNNNNTFLTPFQFCLALRLISLFQSGKIQNNNSLTIDNALSSRNLSLPSFVFEPTDEFQVVPDGYSVPGKVWARMNVSTGKAEVKKL